MQIDSSRSRLIATLFLIALLVASVFFIPVSRFFFILTTLMLVVISLFLLWNRQKLTLFSTPSKQESTRALESVFLLDTFFEKSEDPIFILTSSGKVYRQSKTCESIFHHPIENLDDLKQEVTLWSMLNQSIAIENGATFEWEKASIVYQTHIHPLKFEQTFFGLLVMMKDITSAHKMDQIQTEFLGDLSHELKTPLAAILGASEILNQTERKLSNKERAMFTTIIEKESTRMQRLMDELNHLSLLDNKLFSTLIKSEFFLDELLQEVIQVHTLQLAEKKLTVTLDPSCHTHVFLDRDKAFQIFSNLLSNSIRYTEKGGVMIRCEFIQKHTVIHFSDTGAGIEPQNLSRVFNRFYRTDFARNRVQGGTGLGLAITRAIIEAHHGKIDVQSVLGQGTTFSLTLPNLR